MDGLMPRTDAWGRTYNRDLPPGHIWCSYHDRAQPAVEFSKSLREDPRRRSGWCTEAVRTGQNERRLAKRRP